MRVLVGTSGFSYPEWRGTFYPEDLPESRMLAFYAERFPAVEINASFYRMPSEKMLASMAEGTPESFRFVLKASRSITHIRRLKEKEAAEALGWFLKGTAALGGKLGPVLFGLPPNFKKDLGRLVPFLAKIPNGCRAAFEFRHESWFDAEVFDALRNAGAALCIAEDEKLSTPVVATADWGYLRLRREDYSPADLGRWAAAVKKEAWTEAYVFFKHEDSGAGPALAKAFEKRVRAPEAPTGVKRPSRGRAAALPRSSSRA